MSEPVTDARTTSYSRLSLAEVMRPSSANFNGHVHGGDIFKIADTVAGGTARRHSGGPVVTGYLDDLVYRRPVKVGDVLHSSAQVTWTGRTSMEVRVVLETEPFGDADAGRVEVGTAAFVMVGVDADGRPRQVPPLLVETAEEKRLWRAAEIRREHRRAREAEIAALSEE